MLCFEDVMFMKMSVPPFSANICVLVSKRKLTTESIYKKINLFLIIY